MRFAEDVFSDGGGSVRVARNGFLVISSKAYMGTFAINSTVYCLYREMASEVDDKFRLFAPLNLGHGSVRN